MKWKSLTRVVPGLFLTLVFASMIEYPRAQQERGQSVRIPVEGGQELELYRASYALIIGASDYTQGWTDLPGVVQDVKAVQSALTAQGFTVETLLNPTRDVLDRTVRRFISQRAQAPSNRILIYFAGHGHTIKTEDGRELGYIVPVDAPNPLRSGNSAFKEWAVSMSEIDNYARQIESKHALFIFDSCFSGSIFDAGRSLPPAISEKTSRPVRQFITAGTADQTVPDKSLFRQQFVEALKGEGDLNNDGFITGSELGLFLEEKVTNYTERSQTPQWGKIRNPNLDKGDFVFALPRKGPPPPADPRCAIAWETIKNTQSEATIENFLRECKDAPQAFAANLRLNELRGLRRPEPPAPVKPTTTALTPVIALPRGVPAIALRSATVNTALVDANGRVTRQQAGPVQYYQEDLGKGVLLEMVAVAGGRFQMGSPASEEGHQNDETQHWVQVSDFWMGRYEVTQGQWKAVMDSLPSNMANLGQEFKGDNLPVVNVSWEEAQEFIKKLNAKLGNTNYRLPREAEWEYAARASRSTPFGFGATITPELENYWWDYPYGKAPKKTLLGHPVSVGSYLANPFGLFDMHGNVWEWCEDWYGPYSGTEATDPTGPASGSYRVGRGGGWYNIAVICRSANRNNGAPGYRYDDLGFRLLRTYR